MKPAPLHSVGMTSLVISQSMKRLRQHFEDLAQANSTTPHKPSADQWAALEDIIRCLDGIVTGNSEPVMYLSSLDPGIGKSSALVAYLDVLLAQQGAPHKDCGVLVATNTLAEVERFIDDIGLPKEFLGVWTSRDDLNSLGRPDIGNAQVLITTHERITRELKDSEVWVTDSLYFKGERRRLRVWDEAFLPGNPISLNVDDVLSVMKVLRSVSSPLRAEIKAVFDEIETLEDGTVFHVPDYLERHDVSRHDMLEAANALDPYDEAIKKLNDAQSEIMTGLALVSGRAVKVRKDGYLGNASVGYHETMPADLAPMLILDASGRHGVRVMYDDMENERKLIKRLKSASKDYSNLAIHIWNRGGGKSAWKENGHNLLDGIVSTILAKPDQKWLILHHKKGRGVPDIVREVKSRLSASVAERVSFCNWGKHKATNAHSDVTNIILAGTLFLRPSQYEARKRLASGVQADEGDFTKEELARFELGEYADDILQGLCRGAVRKSQGDTCPPCNAYIIASVHSKIKQALPAIFPKCKIELWQPVKITLKGIAGDAFEIIEAWSKEAKPGDLLKFNDITKQLGVSKRDFKDVRRNLKRFRDTVEGLDVCEWGSKIYFTAYLKA